jgi:ABC-type multidrug transport system fused ATPase/permease subunit
MNNIRYAKLTASDEEVFDACKAACIHDKIMGFTEGTLTIGKFP